MSCQRAVYQWTEVVTTHMPHLSKPQAAVLALWSLGMVLARSCALTAVSLFLAQGLDRKANTVRQQLREWCYEAKAKRGKPRQELAVESCFAPLLAWVLSGWEGHQLALAVDATTLGRPLCGVGGERAVSGLCHSGGVDGVTGDGATCVAGRVAADAAPSAGCGAAPLFCDCLGRSRVVCALVISAHRALGLAPAVTD